MRKTKRITFLSILLLLAFQVYPDTIEKWAVFELQLKGPVQEREMSDVQLTAIFTHGFDSVRVNGFYDGNGIYKIRFMPSATGEWKYQTFSNNRRLRKSGTFTCTSPTGLNRGPIKVTDTFYFAYTSGERYHPVGTTIYRWLEMDKSTRDLTLETLKNSPFNKVRMKVLGPNAGGYNPALYPYKRNPDQSVDFRSPVAAYFQIIDQELQRLLDLGIEADLIFLHPYDRNTLNLDMMGMEDVFQYLDYIIARYAAFRNVWWTTNEFDLMESKSMDDWHSIFEYLQKNDPYNRLRSNHNAGIIYDHTQPWITHASIQGESWWMSGPYRNRYLKPVIFDEFCYEGDGDNRTVSLTGNVITHRFWLMTINGVFASHGEAFINPSTGLRFFSQGGEMTGVSHKQLQTLKKILDEAPGPVKPMGSDWRLRDIKAGAGYEYLIYYLGEYQNKSWHFEELAEGMEYSAEIIDILSGEIITVDEIILKNSRLQLPGKPYLAIKLQQIK
jgi:hypothetical protein